MTPKQPPSPTTLPSHSATDEQVSTEAAGAPSVAANPHVRFAVPLGANESGQWPSPRAVVAPDHPSQELAPHTTDSQLATSASRTDGNQPVVNHAQAALLLQRLGFLLDELSLSEAFDEVDTVLHEVGSF